MRLELPTPRRRQLISLTPLIDVVFILLIFFMLASSFLDWRTIPLATPSTNSRVTSDLTPLQVRIHLDGRLVFEGEALELGQLRAAVRGRLADEPGRSVVVRPDDAVPLQRVVEVLDRVRDSGAGSVRLDRGE
jgi:biopolymer transport protein ExbD